MKLFTIRPEGGSRVIAVTTILPKEWIAVTAKIIKKNNGSVTIKFDKVA